MRRNCKQLLNNLWSSPCPERNSKEPVHSLALQSALFLMELSSVRNVLLRKQYSHVQFLYKEKDWLLVTTSLLLPTGTLPGLEASIPWGVTSVIANQCPFKWSYWLPFGWVSFSLSNFKTRSCFQLIPLNFCAISHFSPLVVIVALSLSWGKKVLFWLSRILIILSHFRPNVLLKGKQHILIYHVPWTHSQVVRSNHQICSCANKKSSLHLQKLPQSSEKFQREKMRRQ